MNNDKKTEFRRPHDPDRDISVSVFSSFFFISSSLYPVYCPLRRSLTVEFAYVYATTTDLCIFKTYANGFEASFCICFKGEPEMQKLPGVESADKNSSVNSEYEKMLAWTRTLALMAQDHSRKGGASAYSAGWQQTSWHSTYHTQKI